MLMEKKVCTRLLKNVYLDAYYRYWIVGSHPVKYNRSLIYRLTLMLKNSNS